MSGDTVPHVVTGVGEHLLRRHKTASDEGLGGGVGQPGLIVLTRCKNLARKIPRDNSN